MFIFSRIRRALNWKQINPDIFGSMMQAVVHTEQRSSMGMHYTSVVNIMKVIEPLFLDGLREELEKAGDNEKKLEKLLQRLYHLRIFDPACGSGNFLIINYKEISRIEIEVYRRLNAIRKSGGLVLKSNISLSQFYGIELDDFAAETAKLSLWLAEHQMNQEFKEVFGDARPTLPLQDSGHIVCNNAIGLDWKNVCPNEKGSEVIIVGNPPYVGGKSQSKKQKEDMKSTFDGIKNFKELDYIACWFMKAALYIDSSSRFAFVTTSSICQGAQVAQLWPHIFKKGLEIFFAYRPFGWANNAKGNAGVSVSIIGVRVVSNKIKHIYNNAVKHEVNHINAYLVNGSTTVVTQALKPISELPPMITGNSPYENGNLTLTTLEKDSLVKEFPQADKFLRLAVGANEFIKGIDRWCLWILDKDLNAALEIPPIRERMDKTRTFREGGGQVARGIAYRSHQFRYTHAADDSQIIIPIVSSESREYIPMGYLPGGPIIISSAAAIYDPEPYVFGVISSRVHGVWVKATAGRLDNRLRYLSALCYNTFPFPSVSEKQKENIEEYAFNILDVREMYSEKSISELYHPDKMPVELRKAHQDLDLAVEQCYRSRPFKSDEERLEYLFKLYEEMIAAEAKQGK